LRKFDKNAFKEFFRQTFGVSYINKRYVTLVFCLVAVVAISAVLVLPTYLKPIESVHSKTITVPDDYRTIDDAVGNASQGTTIYVKRGVYNITEEQLSINKTLTIIGEDPENTILNSAPDTRFGFEFFAPKIAFNIDADNFQICNLTMAGSDYGVYLTGNSSQVSNVTTTNVFVSGNNGTISNNKLSIPNKVGLDCMYIRGSFNNITANNVYYTLDCQGTFNGIIGNSGMKLAVAGYSNFIVENSFEDNPYK
jgi:hypothetical protein